MAHASWTTITGREDEQEHTERLRVQGGWLYRTTVTAGKALSTALVFVPGAVKVKKARPTSAEIQATEAAERKAQIAINRAEVLEARSRTHAPKQIAIP